MMRRELPVLLIVTSCFFFGCEPRPTPEQEAAAQQAGDIFAEAFQPVQATSSMGGTYVGKEGTSGRGLAPAQDRPIAQREEDANTAIADANGRAMSLGGEGGCPSSSLNQGTLTIDYGTGCTINNSTIAGIITIAIALDDRFGVTLTFADFQVDGGDVIDGTFSVALAAGFADALIDLTVNDTESITVAGTVALDVNDVTLNGTLAYDDGTTASSIVLNDVLSEVNGCWARAGTAEVELSQLSGTLHFLSTTPQDGLVDVEVPNPFNPNSTVLIPYQLPPAANCTYTIP